MSPTILVTGGAGYVGSHCCLAFAEAGWNVVVYDNLSRGFRDLVQWGPLIEGDIRDAEGLKAAIRETKPDAVAHFAALAYVGESVNDPARYYDVNTRGSLNLLQAMVEHGIDKLVFSSTCATYGSPPQMPITEATPQAPINPYGASKLFVERMLQDFAHAYGTRSVALRYFNAAGADAQGRTGERHVPETHLIPLAIEAAARNGNELTVFGDDFATPDGTCVRDYIHVTDLADAHVRAVRLLLDGAAGDVFNLGTESGTSVKEVIDAVGRACGRQVPHSIGPRRQGDPAVLVASAAKARRTLGWAPRHSSIDRIVEDALKWFLKYRGVAAGDRPADAAASL